MSMFCSAPVTENAKGARQRGHGIGGCMTSNSCRFQKRNFHEKIWMLCTLERSLASFPYNLTMTFNVCVVTGVPHITK